jgi:hypothetical protein
MSAVISFSVVGMVIMMLSFLLMVIVKRTGRFHAARSS